MTAHRRNLRTFDNQTGRNVFYRAAIHPMTAPLTDRLIERVAAAGSVAVYDPSGYFADLAAMHDLSRWRVAGVYVQRMEQVGGQRCGFSAQPVTALAESNAELLFVAEFEAEKRIAQLGPYRPSADRAESLDSLRLGPEWLTAPDRYLDPQNFVSDFLFFRDAGGLHTTISTTNYWHGHAAGDTRLWCRLFGADGATLATWEEKLPSDAGSIAFDSRQVRNRFALGDFTGSLFVHVIGTARHDTLKYAVDIFDDSGNIATATHDSNPWAADFYAGLPTPRAGEKVRLWIQNCYATPIPAGAVGFRVMGDGPFTAYPDEIPPYGTRAADVGALFPRLAWPAQIEVRADKYFCRPRYEIEYGDGLASVAHANVERTDLEPAPDLAGVTRTLGKGFILPAPILPRDAWSTVLLPTPMATSQEQLTLTLRAYGADGNLVAETALGPRRRNEQVAVAMDEILPKAGPTARYGHLELGYDFASGAQADGWLHAIFRYTRRDSGRMAETSFGSHMFNVPATWRSEPNSYLGPPPGLSTRLYLRLTERPGRVMCHLIYPTSGRWKPLSETDLILHSARGEEVVRRRIEIPCSGSALLDMTEIFSAAERVRANGGYVMIRDTSCRLFGYHLFMSEAGGFALDHMFGF
ncbi:MAG TPA: hypothetical protein VKZ79_10035 [Alphaproteobacteria bacterium]|nr:hypothetical protein [Alphaproteobacteria bacterium]